MAPRKERKDKGTKREITKIADKLYELSAEVLTLANQVREYDQRDRLKADKS